MGTQQTAFSVHEGHIYRPQTKFREGIVSTPVCDSVHKGCGMHAGEIATIEGSTHPTGMHSCRDKQSILRFVKLCVNGYQRNPFNYNIYFSTKMVTG